ncbi:MAG TPA: monovalent cation/H+ antiporter subunit D, partial [Kiloniellaceae bacterium]
VPGPARPGLPLAAAGAMVAGMVALAVFAGPINGYLDATAAGLFDPTAYLHAVLGPEAVAAR